MRVSDTLVEQDHGDEVVAGDGEAAEADENEEKAIVGGHAVTSGLGVSASTMRRASSGVGITPRSMMLRRPRLIPVNAERTRILRPLERRS